MGLKITTANGSDFSTMENSANINTTPLDLHYILLPFFYFQRDSYNYYSSRLIRFVYDRPVPISRHIHHILPNIRQLHQQILFIRKRRRA